MLCPVLDHACNAFEPPAATCPLQDFCNATILSDDCNDNCDCPVAQPACAPSNFSVMPGTCRVSSGTQEGRLDNGKLESVSSLMPNLATCLFYRRCLPCVQTECKQTEFCGLDGDCLCPLSNPYCVEDTAAKIYSAYCLAAYIVPQACHPRTPRHALMRHLYAD